MQYYLSKIRSVLRSGLICVALASLSIQLTACSENEPQSFAPLDYSYLDKINLNVAHLDVIDSAPPGSTPGDISGKAPITLQQALEQMAHDRLIPGGSEGRATFTITRASILHAPGGTLHGDLEAHVDLAAPSGGRAGYALAHITRSLNPGAKDPESASVLYSLTAQMMQDMNIELEFQIKKTLHDWLVDASGAPLPGAIHQQDIEPTSSLAASAVPTMIPPASTATSASDHPLNPASAKISTSREPDAVFPLGDETSPPSAASVASPKPGILSLPSGHS